MGTKLSEGRWFVPFYAWTREEYFRRADEAALRDAPAPPTSSRDEFRTSPKVPVDRKVGLPALLEAIGKPLPWELDALCKEYPSVDFFADHDQDAAKDVCSRCLVRVECRTAGEHEVGIWGATTSRERARLRRSKVA